MPEYIGQEQLAERPTAKSRQSDHRGSQISVEWLFGAGCGMQSHTFPMMPCISAAHHFYGEPNLKIADFQFSSRDWGVKSPASSPSTKITKVSFEATRANLALVILEPLKHHDRT